MQRAEAEGVLRPGRLQLAAWSEPAHSVHPSAEQLARFFRGELSRPEVVPIVRHLLRGCAECVQVTGPLWELMQERPRKGRET